MCYVLTLLYDSAPAVSSITDMHSSIVHQHVHAYHYFTQTSLSLSSHALQVVQWGNVSIMPEPPGQIRFRRTCSLHTHQVHIPSITFFFSLTPFDPFFLPPSLPLTLHLSLSFTLCYLPFLLSVSYLCFLICVISLAYFSSSPPFFPIFMTFQTILFHSIP